MSAASAVLLLHVAVLVTACSRDPVSGPPELRVGRDICAECNMLISEDRCSSAMLVEVRGRREYIMFDDISCMIDYQDKEHDFTHVDTFVRDYVAREWTDAATAHFLFADSDRLRTPMGSGMVAFAELGSAQEKQTEVGGEIMTYDQLAAAHRQ